MYAHVVWLVTEKPTLRRRHRYDAQNHSVLLAASPLLDGVSGRYFEDNQESEVVDGGPEVMAGVARWSVDPAAADCLWDHALPLVG